ncbi:MAG: ATP-binding protein [Bacteroidia bacterium]|nr:ATP-binding protein [Bacteroidia bacterium]
MTIIKPITHTMALKSKNIKINSNEAANTNSQTILNEINWLKSIIEKRVKDLKPEAGKNPEADQTYRFEEGLPDLDKNNSSYYAQLVCELELNAAERLLLILSLTAHIAPDVFSIHLRDDRSAYKPRFAEMGGYIDTVFFNFVPSLKTALYLIAANDLDNTLKLELFFTTQSKLVNEQIITFNNHVRGEECTLQYSIISLAPEYINYFVSGKKPRPDFGKNFPASLLTTGLNWEDLVVPEFTLKELQRLSKWHSHGLNLIQKTNGKLNGSFTCLFYGASGSGKTLAVQLLGKSLGVDVFRIDLSMVVSKYIGETEKNLAYLFDRAKNKNWILFFDEADALFGKRTEIKDSKDKWANLEMSYLLQRMEEHNGLTVLATNFRNNLDVALSRRFQSVIYFAKPDKAQRIELWKRLMPKPYSYESGIDFEQLGHYELTGGNITNIIKAACLDANHANTEVVASADIVEAIKREFAKENRILTQ